MREYDVWDKMLGEWADIIYGYDRADARRRTPAYVDEKRYLLFGGAYID